MLLRSLFEARSTKYSPAHPRDPVLAQLFGGGINTSAGQAVTAETAMQISAVFACVSLISDTVAATPLMLLRRTDKAKEPARDHSLFGVMHRHPNGYQTAFEFRQLQTMEMLLRGAGYARIRIDARGRRMLEPMPSDYIRPQLTDGRVIYDYQEPGAPRRVLLQEEVLRVPFAVWRGVDPVNPIRFQRETIGGALAAQEYGNRFWANDARPGSGWVEVPGSFKTDEDEKAFRRKLQEMQAGDNHRKIAVFSNGIKYHPLSVDNADAQYLESIRARVEDIARMFRVQPHMIGAHDKGASFASVEQQSLDFVVHTISHYFVRWEQALTRDLLDEREREELFFSFNAAGLLRGDIKSRYESYAKGRQWGFLSANDIRALENMPPIDSGDIYLSPGNMTPADQAGDDDGD